MKIFSHDAAPEYHPNRIGLTSSGGPADCEILVWGRGDDFEAIPKALETCLNHGAKLLTISSYFDKVSRNFQLHLCCDLSSLDTPLDGLLIKIRKVKSVKDAQLKSLKGRLFSAQLFPLTFTDKYRVAALGSHLIVELDKRLNEIVGSKGRVVLSEEGRQFALELAELAAKSCPNSSKEEILENVRNALRAGGWGDFTFQTEEASTTAHAIVVDPPTLGGDLADGPGFIGGIAEGISEFILNGEKMSVESATYNKFTRILTMNLMAKKKAKDIKQQEKTEAEKEKVEAEKEKMVEAEIVKTKSQLQRERAALKEIDSIIFSLDEAGSAGKTRVKKVETDEGTEEEAAPEQQIE
jgi:hypothetical protein